MITLAHGSGGKQSHALIDTLFKKYFSNPYLQQGGDAALLPTMEGKIAMTTDSYVISPVFFPGGDIGKIAVCGTVNDLAVSGAVPMYLSCGFILEEGLSLAELEEIVASMARTANDAGVFIVTGDTKVVPKGCCDKLYINTTGIGYIPQWYSEEPLPIEEGDGVILSGTMGDHGTAILLERENFEFTSSIQSDSAPLNQLILSLTSKFQNQILVMRDPTRGGVGTTLNELVKGQTFGILLEESALPIHPEVMAVNDLLGLDPMYMANEGKFLLFVKKDKIREILSEMHHHPLGENAALIGHIVENHAGKLLLKTVSGGTRIVDMLVGDQLPRIC